MISLKRRISITLLFLFARSAKKGNQEFLNLKNARSGAGVRQITCRNRSSFRFRICSSRMPIYSKAENDFLPAGTARFPGIEKTVPIYRDGFLLTLIACEEGVENRIITSA